LSAGPEEFLHIIRVGPWTFVGWPEENFVEHAPKAQAPDTFVISLANGEFQGDIATETAAIERDYEATNALFAPFSASVFEEETSQLIS
jgi:neutral ceramidase